MTPEVLGILGTLCLLALSLVAWLFRGMLSAMDAMAKATTALEISVAVLVNEKGHAAARMAASDIRMDNLEKSLLLFRDSTHALRNEFGPRLMKLELEVEKLKGTSVL